MNEKDLKFFQTQMTAIQTIQTQINDLTNNIYHVLDEKEKRYDERKESYDKKQDELHQAVVRLFSKTDDLQNASNELNTTVASTIQKLHIDIGEFSKKVLKKEDLNCPIHAERLQQMENSISRIFTWIWSIIMGMIAIIFKK